MPWAVETSGGLRCTKLTGATDIVRGQRVNYGCTDGSVLVGDVDDSSDLWTIMRSPSGQPEKGDLERVNLRRAWRPVGTNVSAARGPKVPAGRRRRCVHDQLPQGHQDAVEDRRR